MVKLGQPGIHPDFLQVDKDYSMQVLFRLFHSLKIYTLLRLQGTGRVAR
jgi:hypothetical protein